MTQPLVSTLTRIGTVEGFGAMIRHSEVPDLRGLFVEDIDGTAMVHLDRGLYEAHARDEAGFEDEGGHKQMWFAARDIAFETSRDRQTRPQLMLQRMGINVGPGATPPPPPPTGHARRLDHDVRAARRADDAAAAHRDLRVPHLRRGPRRCSAKTDLVAGDGDAAKLVSYVRADETPHVEYLKTVLTEMRDRTIVGDSGRKHDGAELIGAVWERALAESLGARRQLGIKQTVGELEHVARGESSAPTSSIASTSSDPKTSQEERPPMKFGIFYEHQLPRPWDDDSERELIQDALEQVELADKLGIHYVWEVEHHFLEEYSHSSAPGGLPRRGSQRTKNIRLGHGIIQTAPDYNHPARTAERVATLDLVSNGRVEFGSGESSSEAELGGFQIDPMLKREMWLEGLEVAIRCMTETPFTGVDGKYVPDAAAQRRAQAGAEAAPAAVGRVLTPRDDPPRRREGHRSADVRVHRSRRGDPLGQRLRVDARREVCRRSARPSTRRSRA